jgi:tetratricopeptide (TPR) repeat protein
MDDIQARMDTLSSTLQTPDASLATHSSTMIFQNSDMSDLGKIDDATFISQTAKLEVTLPDSEEAEAMMRMKLSYKSHDTQNLRDLVLTLQHSPLAITLAAAYIEENALNLREYLTLFKLIQSGLETKFIRLLGSPQEEQRIPKSIAAAFLLALKQVKEENPFAIEILSLSTVLDRQILPTALLFNKDHQDYQVRPFYRAIRKLQRLSLITTRTSGASYSMNRYIQKLCQAWLQEQDKLGFWNEQALIVSAKRYGLGDQSFWRSSEIINPHALKILDSSAAIQSCLPLGMLLRRMGACDQLQGNYSRAFERYIKALKIFRESSEYGRTHRETFSIAEKAAGVLTFMDQNERAEKMIEEIREEMTKARGDKDHQFLASGNTLAKIYHSRGKYREAEKLYEAALEANTAAYHETHVDSLTIKTNLATVLRDQGRLDEAEKYFQEAWEGRKVELEVDHPDTLQSMSNLATVWTRQGKNVEAEKLTREAWTISERIQGPNHPDTLSMLNNLAINLANLGRYSEAAEMHQRHVAIKKDIFGLENSGTIIAKLNLAVLLDKIGKIPESEKEYEEALAANQKLFPENDNPTTLNLWSSLGVVYLKQKKYPKAEEMIKKSLEQREKSLGPGHQLTLISRNNLAGVMQRLGKYSEAEEGFRTVLKSSSKLGEGHPLILRVKNNLGELLRESRMKPDDASKFLNEALDGRERVLGRDHPDTLTTMYNLAHLFHDNKQFDKAALLYRESLEGLIKKLGPGHATTIDCAKNFDLVKKDQKGAGSIKGL